MKTPDKIYINVTPLGVDYSIVPIPDFGGVEYIRKDALLEWAETGKKMLESEEAAALDDKIRYGANAVYNELIRALNSL